jgi:5-methyltetrahydrofolate--homocysteine methyltransferase
MKSSLELLRPHLASGGAEPTGRVVIGTVKGDLHDIGKNLVASLLEGGGFQVVDLGVDVSPSQFLNAIQKHRADILALSALLTTTRPAMKTVVDAVRQAGLRDQVKILIGGAPVTRQYADEIGADAYSRDAVAAVSIARALIGKEQPCELAS